MKTVGNVFLVRGCEKTIIQIHETGAVAEPAASHQVITVHQKKQQHSNTIHQAMQKKEQKNNAYRK